uniref:Uncharacterized protein n=1 Tax=Anguilla anguilla TaxID=7936 RepID=A0A0E9X6B8_ANGAN
MSTKKNIYLIYFPSCNCQICYIALPKFTGKAHCTCVEVSDPGHGRTSDSEFEVAKPNSKTLDIKTQSHISAFNANSFFLYMFLKNYASI